MKGCSAKLLFGCPTPIIIDTAIRDRHSARFNYNFNDILTLNFKMVGLREYPSVADNLVRYILQLLLEMVNANNSHVIVDADVNLSTLCVSEAGYPLQVLVFPYTFIFSILVLVVHIRSQENLHKTNRYASSCYAKLSQNTDIHKLICISEIA